jgi:outer membrane immunogenic protein
MEPAASGGTVLRKALCAAAAVVAALLAAPGPAAAQPAPDYAPTHQRLFNWTGFYAGLHGGWGWGDANVARQDGYTLGGQAGFNHQFVNGILIGIETDISFTSADANLGGAAFSIDYFGTVRGRLGYAFDRVLVYATGGAAYASGKLSVGPFTNDHMHFGYVLGFGLEGMITPNLSVRIEYLYTDFHSRTFQTIVGPVGVGFDSSFLRAGVNYRF